MGKTTTPKLIGDKTPKSIQDLFGSKGRNDDAKYYGNNEFLQGLYSGYNAGSAWRERKDLKDKEELVGKVVGDYIKGDSTTTSFGNLLGENKANSFDASNPQFEGMYSNQPTGDKGSYMNFDKANPSAMEQSPVFKQNTTQAVTTTTPNVELTSTQTTPRDFLKSSRADFMDRYVKAGGSALDAGIIYDSQISPMVAEAKTNRLGQIIQQYNTEKDPAKKTALEAEYAAITQNMYGGENQQFKRNADQRAQNDEARTAELHPYKVEGAKLYNENLQTTITGNQMKNEGAYPYAKGGTGTGSGTGGKSSIGKIFNKDGLDPQQAIEINALEASGNVEEAKALKAKYLAQNGMAGDMVAMLANGMYPIDIYNMYASHENGLSPAEIHQGILNAMIYAGYDKNTIDQAMAGLGVVSPQQTTQPSDGGGGQTFTPANLPIAPSNNDNANFKAYDVDNRQIANEDRGGIISWFKDPNTSVAKSFGFYK